MIWDCNKCLYLFLTDITFPPSFSFLIVYCTLFPFTLSLLLRSSSPTSVASFSYCSSSLFHTFPSPVPYSSTLPQPLSYILHSLPILPLHLRPLLSYFQSSLTFFFHFIIHYFLRPRLSMSSVFSYFVCCPLSPTSSVSSRGYSFPLELLLIAVKLNSC